LRHRTGSTCVRCLSWTLTKKVEGEGPFLSASTSFFFCSVPFFLVVCTFVRLLHVTCSEIWIMPTEKVQDPRAFKRAKLVDVEVGECSSSSDLPPPSQPPPPPPPTAAAAAVPLPPEVHSTPNRDLIERWYPIFQKHAASISDMFIIEVLPLIQNGMCRTHAYMLKNRFARVCKATNLLVSYISRFSECDWWTPPNPGEVEIPLNLTYQPNNCLVWQTEGQSQCIRGHARVWLFHVARSFEMIALQTRAKMCCDRHARIFSAQICKMKRVLRHICVLSVRNKCALQGGGRRDGRRT